MNKEQIAGVSIEKADQVLKYICNKTKSENDNFLYKNLVEQFVNNERLYPSNIKVEGNEVNRIINYMFDKKLIYPNPKKTEMPLYDQPFKATSSAYDLLEEGGFKGRLERKEREEKKESRRTRTQTIAPWIAIVVTILGWIITLCTRQSNNEANEQYQNLSNRDDSIINLLNNRIDSLQQIYSQSTQQQDSNTVNLVDSLRK